MLSIFTKIPANWRKAIYVGTAILTAGLFAFGIVAPTEFDATVSQWVKIFTDLAALFAAVTALANVTKPEA